MHVKTSEVFETYEVLWAPKRQLLKQQSLFFILHGGCSTAVGYSLYYGYHRFPPVLAGQAVPRNDKQPVIIGFNPYDSY